MRPGLTEINLIREGLARPYACGSYSCPKRKPWCQAAA